jgi:hypothetical protein
MHPLFTRANIHHKSIYKTTKIPINTHSKQSDIKPCLSPAQVKGGAKVWSVSQGSCYNKYYLFCIDFKVFSEY